MHPPGPTIDVQLLSGLPFAFKTSSGTHTCDASAHAVS